MNEKNLLTQTKFFPIFWTMFLGAFNDNLFKNALIVLITYKVASMSGVFIDLDAKSMVAVCAGIFILPFFLFSALAGQISDKYSKSRLIFLIKVWEVIVMIFGAVGFLLNNLSLLMVTLFFMGLQSTFFGPIKYSILPEVLDDGELVQGNAYFSMGTFIAILLGTIAGGLIINIAGYGQFAISLGVISFGFLGLYSSSKVTKLVAISPELKINYGILKPSWNILKITAKDRNIFIALSAISWFWFLGAALLSMFPAYAKDSIGGDESVVTLFLGLFSIGIAVGSLLCEKFSYKKLELAFVPVGCFGMSLFLFDLFLVGTPPQVLIPLSAADFIEFGINLRIVFDLFMVSIFAGFFTVPLYTYIQKFSPETERSRVIAGLNIYNAFLMVFSAFFLIFLYQLNFSMGEIFGVLSLLNLIVGLMIFKKMPIFLISLKEKIL